VALVVPLSTSRPFQQFWNFTSSSSASSGPQDGSAAKRGLPSMPPQLQDTISFDWPRRAIGFPATSFRPDGGATRVPETFFV
jgi:hypothetical protein